MYRRPSHKVAMRENEHFPRRGIRGGLASVSVIHSPLVQTPLPSVPLLCHCLQTLPAATLAPCIRLRLGSSHQGREHNICSHGQVHVARRSQVRRVMQTDRQLLSLWRALIRSPHSHTHYLNKSSFKALHMRTSDCCHGCTSWRSFSANADVLLLLTHTLRKAKILHFFSISRFSVFCGANSQKQIWHTELYIFILQIFSWFCVFWGRKTTSSHFTILHFHYSSVWTVSCFITSAATDFMQPSVIWLKWM